MTHLTVSNVSNGMNEVYWYLMVWMNLLDWLTCILRLHLKLFAFLFDTIGKSAENT